MLDINLIRKDPEKIKSALLKKVENIDFTELLDFDKKKREIIHEVETLKAKRNEVSALIPRLKKEGKDASAELSEMKSVSDRIKNLDGELAIVSEKNAVNS